MGLTNLLKEAIKDASKGALMGRRFISSLEEKQKTPEYLFLRNYFENNISGGECSLVEHLGFTFGMLSKPLTFYRIVKKY